MKNLLPLAIIGLFITSGIAAQTSQTALIHVKGSDTMFVVAQAWAEAFEIEYPAITISVGGGGSGTGFDSLLNGSVEVANASRRISTHELQRAQRLGMNPAEHVVGYDALAVYVHRDNPVRDLSLKQLAGIFGEGADLTRWTDLGITVPDCSGQKIIRAGRQNNSGTHVYFRNAVLGAGRDYDLEIMDMLSSKDVVHLVEKTPCAIGYSGLAYATDNVARVCVKKTERSDCILPSINSAVDGSYPIARPLFIYTRTEPEAALKQYLDWILSPAGQCVIQRQGYAPVTPVSCQ